MAQGFRAYQTYVYVIYTVTDIGHRGCATWVIYYAPIRELITFFRSRGDDKYCAAFPKCTRSRYRRFNLSPQKMHQRYGETKEKWTKDLDYQHALRTTTSTLMSAGVSKIVVFGCAGPLNNKPKKFTTPAGQITFILGLRESIAKEKGVDPHEIQCCIREAFYPVKYKKFLKQLNFDVLETDSSTFEALEGKSLLFTTDPLFAIRQAVAEIGILPTALIWDDHKKRPRTIRKSISFYLSPSPISMSFWKQVRPDHKHSHIQIESVVREGWKNDEWVQLEVQLTR